MLKQERTKWAQACDTCTSAACTVYCWADSAYLCTTCDAQVHAANSLASRHERVRVCQSCERAPASFFCKADAASLCTACDSEIHSANPLARRHQRVPITPISGNTFTNEIDLEMVVGEDEEDEAEAASWLLPNSGKNNNGFSFSDEYLDLVDQSNEYQLDCNVVPQRSYEGDGVVPLQTEPPKSHMNHTNGGSLSHMVHVSSIDLGLVPESTTSEATTLSSPKGVTEQLAYPQAQMLSPMDREARVMRYREKKKTRKFEKTIRYASRKAYAEKRPRIKGRFAKREEVDAEANEAFSTMIKFDNGYGIVPSF